MKMHADDVEPVPKAESAEPSVGYSLDWVPERRTVRQPLGVLVRVALFASSTLDGAGAALVRCSCRLNRNSTRLVERIRIVS
jgi:hypothetical protein